ncbi:MAG: YggT family protein [Neisseria sp.]|uniref:YggT family protein n=1 Tax=Neisseria sp. TaxID=192066 RepID=UPI0026DCE9D8|nr:YggT family protein [Neisseria sp.]MDO4640589.1 YggT family protein [Neisseria sp.]
MLQKIIQLLADGFALLCVGRCLLQWGRMHADHPAARFCQQFTDWLVRPLSKVFKPIGRWNLACIIAPTAVYYLAFTVIIFISLPGVAPTKSLLAVLCYTLIEMVKISAYLLFIGLFARMVLSFNNPNSKLLITLNNIFEPLLRPFVFLKIGRYDFSGSILVLVLWIWLVTFSPNLIQKLDLWLLS